MPKYNNVSYSWSLHASTFTSPDLFLNIIFSSLLFELICTTARAIDAGRLRGKNGP